MNREEKICTFIIVIIIIAIIGYVSYSYIKGKADKEREEEARSKLFIENGDRITFEVTGWIQDNNQVFYTTEQSVDEDPGREKSPNYIFYSDDPDSAVVGEELTSRFTKGFTEKVLNMKIGEEDIFTVYADLGYGMHNESLLREIPVNDVLPLYEEQPIDGFQNTYNPEDTPLYIGQRFNHVYWGWPIELVELENETVTYRHSPSMNFEITVMPWPSEVTGVSEKDNKLFIRHNADMDILYTTIDPLELAEYDPSFIDIQDVQSNLGIGLLKGIITDIDKNSITIDFNDERAGKTILYEITIIDIIKA